ncbi:MAG: gamma-glutamylcyclotransferase [Herminiimonas sp.]|nr:gamma-glutamylcyclotransferase [Herminiimonas sp.]
MFQHVPTQDAPTHNVFTYGSLMFAPVWERVVQGRYRSAAARLDGHGRFALVDDTYPGMVPMDGATVAGVLYFDVGVADMAMLDHFEGDEYRRTPVQVQLDDGGQAAAQTYVFEAHRRLSSQPWNPEAFALDRFLDSYCRDKLG